MGYENPSFLNKPQSLPCFFQKWVWGEMCLPQSGTQDEKVRSLPWATNIEHFQTSLRACRVFFRNGCGTNCFAAVWETRRESEVPAIGYENLTFPNKLQSLPGFRQKWVWGQMFSPQSGRQDRNVRSLPWATKIKHFQTSLTACLVFFGKGCGDKTSRPSLELNVEK